MLVVLCQVAAFVTVHFAKRYEWEAGVTWKEWECGVIDSFYDAPIRIWTVGLLWVVRTGF
jgi:hypothetical protein